MQIAHDTTMGRRLLALAVVTLTVLGLVVGHAQAAPAFERGIYAEGLFYSNFDEGITLFAGGPATEACTGDEPEFDAKYFIGKDGTVRIQVTPAREELYLYASPLPAPLLLDEICAALFDDDPTTVPLEAFASGFGKMKQDVEIVPDGLITISNSSWGSVSSEDGSTWNVRGRADLQVDPATGPIGDPAEFQSLQIIPTP